jgi:ABC-2 type transport system ATP-binding protein
MSEAEHCDQLALMYAGRIVAEGSPADMKDQVEKEAGQLLEVSTDQPGTALRRVTREGFPGAALFGTKLHLLSHDLSQDEVRLRKALSSDGVRIESIATRPLSLEDVFVHRVMTLEQQERETQGEAAA